MNSTLIVFRGAAVIRVGVLSLAVLLTAPLFVSCNTTAGFGRDLNKAGDAIEDAARR